MAPAPTSPIRKLSAICLTPGEPRVLAADAVGDEIDVLFGEPFVPRQDQDLFEAAEGAGEVLLPVVDRLRPGEGERKTAVTEGPLIAQHFATEGRLLDVTRGGGDAVALQAGPERGRAPFEDGAVDPDAVAPVAVLGPRGVIRRGNSLAIG